MLATEQIQKLLGELTPPPAQAGMAHLDWTIKNEELGRLIKGWLPLAQFEQGKRIADALERIADAMEGEGARSTLAESARIFGNERG